MELEKMHFNMNTGKVPFEFINRGLCTNIAESF